MTGNYTIGYPKQLARAPIPADRGLASAPLVGTVDPPVIPTRPMNIYTITILISVVIYIIVGNVVGRKIKNLEEYFVAGRNAPTLLIVGTLVASFLSTNTFMGQAGFNYGFNSGLIVIPALLLIGYIYGAIFFGRYLRRSRKLTVVEYLSERFDSRRVQLVASITVIVGVGFYLIAVTQGVALILSNLTPLSYTQALVLAWISYTSFTLYSGSKGVILTDTMMFLLFSGITFIAMISLFNMHGGWLQAMEGLVKIEGKEGLMSWSGLAGPGQRWETPADYITWQVITMLAWSFVTAISPWQSSRYLMAKTEHVVLRSACIAAISIGIIQTMVFCAASIVNLSNPAIEPRDEVLIWAALNLLSPIVGALLLAGLVAAALSSASTFLSLIGFNLSNDVFRNDRGEDKAKLNFSRRCMLISGVVILVISLSIEQNIFWLSYFAGTMFASAWGVVALMSVWSSRITAAAAFWGIVAGFLGNVVPKILVLSDIISLPAYFDPIVLGTAASLITVILVSRRTTVTDREREFRLSLLATPAEEIDASATQRTLWFGYAVGLFGVATTIIMIIYYVMPYQRATAPAGADVAIDWFTGEAIAAYAWAVIFVPMSYLMVQTIRRGYLPPSAS